MRGQWTIRGKTQNCQERGALKKITSGLRLCVCACEWESLCLICWHRIENPTNIAGVNLLMGCSKGFFSLSLTIPTPALAFLTPNK